MNRLADLLPWGSHRRSRSSCSPGTPGRSGRDRDGARGRRRPPPRTGGFGEDVHKFWLYLEGPDGETRRYDIFDLTGTDAGPVGSVARGVQYRSISKNDPFPEGDPCWTTQVRFENAVYLLPDSRVLRDDNDDRIIHDPIVVIGPKQ